MNTVHRLLNGCLTLALLSANTLASAQTETQTEAQTEAQTETLPGYQRIEFRLPADTGQIVLTDANADSLKDVLRINGNRLSLHLQKPNAGGFDFTTPDAVLQLPGTATGWDISHNYPNPAETTAENSRRASTFSLIALVDGRQVQQWALTDEGFAQAHTLLDQLTGFLSDGYHRVNFSRDINADGMDDLLIPGSGELFIHLRNQDGSYQPGFSVLSDMRIRTRLNSSDNLERDTGQSVSIPLMQLRDVNNDGKPDLISDTDERLDVFLANPGADQGFPLQPSYSVDRLAIRERLGEFDLDQVDFSNLTGILALTYQEVLQDINNDGIDDLILREGGKVSLYHGAADGVSFERPAQILRSAGNVLLTFAHDENEDGLPDLWLWRIEPISVGDLFLWLAISGSVNLEAFIYPNEGQRFASRPVRKVTVALKFPSAVRLLSTVSEFRERSRDDSAAPLPNLAVSLDAAAADRDLAVLMQNQLLVFRQALAPKAEVQEERFLASLNYSRDRDNYEIDIRNYIDQVEQQQESALNLTNSREPDHSIAWQEDMRHGNIISSDLNANGVDDLFVLLAREEEYISGFLLLSSPGNTLNTAAGNEP
ncbi:MAG: VCBS repeat-containing protein [Pseudomonadales bacterium]|nr:VCBS repeat-containing protein [Pseudomonadales bacterium]